MLLVGNALAIGNRPACALPPPLLYGVRRWALGGPAGHGQQEGARASYQLPATTRLGGLGGCRAFSLLSLLGGAVFPISCRQLGRISWVERRCAMGIRVASGTGQWGVGWTAAGSVPSSESPEEVPHAARRRRWLLALAASAKSFRQTWTSTSGAFQVDGRRARREAVPVSTSHEPRQGKGPAHFLTSLFRVLTSYRS